MWTIFDEFERMRNDMDKMFRDFNMPKQIGPASQKARCPVVNQYEKKDKMVTEIELPGVDKKDVQLYITDEYAEVKVEQKDKKEVEDNGIYQYESRSQSFFRHIPFPEPIDSKNAKATQKEGVLKIEAPKLELKDSKRKLLIE